MNRRISSEDLYMLRQIVAKDMSIEARADDYSRVEREDHYARYLSFLGDLFARYEVPESDYINPRTGEISAVA